MCYSQETFEEILFENKYFKASVPVIIQSFDNSPHCERPFGVVFVYSQGFKEFLAQNPDVLSSSECNILFSEKNIEDFEDFEDLGLEILIESLEEFKGFQKNEEENIGIGRIKEALECAAASVIKTPAKPLTTEDDNIEKEIEDFEYFLKKIKENCEKSKEVDDETRKKNAEETIRELTQYLRLEDDD